MLNCQLNEQVLYLEGQLQVHHLDKIKTDLAALANDNQPLQVDFSRVEDVDVAGLQIMLAFLQSRKSATKVQRLSAELAKGLAITGLEPLFAKFME
jgi:ABC-type transporter Mla MlaB component